MLGELRAVQAGVACKEPGIMPGLVCQGVLAHRPSQDNISKG